MILDKIKETEDLIYLKVKEKENLLNEISSFQEKVYDNENKIISLDLEKEKLEDKLEKLKQTESYLINDDVDTKEEKQNIIKKKEKELNKDLAFFAFILEKIKSNKELIKEYDQFIEEWRLDKKYHKGIIIKSKGVYFKCIKTHTSSFETIPIVTNDIWEDIFKKNNVDFYYRDKTYMKGDMVKFYGVIYISEIDYNDSEPSEKNNKWRII